MNVHMIPPHSLQMPSELKISCNIECRYNQNEPIAKGTDKGAHAQHSTGKKNGTANDGQETDDEHELNNIMLFIQLNQCKLTISRPLQSYTIANWPRMPVIKPAV